MTFPLFHCSLHSRPHHAVSVQCCCSDTQRHVRSHFDSKALHFRIRPYCHKRGLRVSGGKCGPCWCMSPIRLAPFYQGGGKCWQCMAVRPLLSFHALFGKEKPGQCPPKKLGICRACWLILGPVCRGHSLPKKQFPPPGKVRPIS